MIDDDCEEEDTNDEMNDEMNDEANDEANVQMSNKMKLEAKRLENFEEKCIAVISFYNAFGHLPGQAKGASKEEKNLSYFLARISAKLRNDGKSKNASKKSKVSYIRAITDKEMSILEKYNLDPDYKGCFDDRGILVRMIGETYQDSKYLDEEVMYWQSPRSLCKNGTTFLKNNDYWIKRTSTPSGKKTSYIDTMKQATIFNVRNRVFPLRFSVIANSNAIPNDAIENDAGENDVNDVGDAGENNAHDAGENDVNDASENDADENNANDVIENDMNNVCVNNVHEMCENDVLENNEEDEHGKSEVFESDLNEEDGVENPVDESIQSSMSDSVLHEVLGKIPNDTNNVCKTDVNQVCKNDVSVNDMPVTDLNEIDMNKCENHLCESDAHDASEKEVCVNNMHEIDVNDMFDNSENNKHNSDSGNDLNEDEGLSEETIFEAIGFVTMNANSNCSSHVDVSNSSTMISAKQASTISSSVNSLKGQTIVILYGGGKAMKSPELFKGFCNDIAILQNLNVRVVVVHGCDPQFVSMFDRVVRTINVGQVIGEVMHEHTTSLLFQSLDTGITPMVFPIGTAVEEEVYSFAVMIAGKLKASRILFLTDTGGVLDKEVSLLKELSIQDAEDLIQDGTISGGMIQKVTCATDAIQLGVKSAFLIDGRIPNVVLNEILAGGAAGKGSGTGTIITAM